MSYNIKDIFKVGLLVFIYVMFGIIGIYSSSLIIFLPILSIPMTIYLISKDINKKMGFRINLLIALSIFLIKGSIVEVMWYTLNVTVPACAVATMYKKKLSIPQIVMYTATALIGVLCLYIIVFQYAGINYIQAYYDVLEMYQGIQFEVFNKVSEYGLKTEQIDLLKEVIVVQIDILKKVYPAIVFILMIWFMVIQVSIVTLIGKMKKWKMASLKQLIEFKWSKCSIILFIASFILIQGEFAKQSIASILGWNIFFLINSLYQFIGIISIIVLIKRTKLNKIMKILGGIVAVILMYSSPSMLMMFGLLDTMFNYRKVNNIV